MNENIWGDFQICISVPLKVKAALLDILQVSRMRFQYSKWLVVLVVDLLFQMQEIYVIWQ